MSHNIDTYKFDTEEEAIYFSNKIKSSPVEDRYVSVPVFIDQEEIFKNVHGETPDGKWWQVTIEYFK